MLLLLLIMALKALKTGWPGHIMLRDLLTQKCTQNVI
jgi:hypothetical protein